MSWIWMTGLTVIILLAFAAAVMALVGSRLPEGHVTRAKIKLRQKPGAVFALVRDISAYPTWCGVNKVERLPDRNGHETWRQHMGRNAFVIEVTRSEEPQAFVQTIADEARIFGGRWEYTIHETPEGCEVTLTEHGFVKPAIPRFMMKYIVDPAMYLKRQLRSVAAKFGEPHAPVEATVVS